MIQKYISQFQSAESAGVPIVIVRTTDPSSTMAEIMASYQSGEVEPMAFLQWDVCRGVVGLDKLGIAAAAKVNVDNESPPAIQSSNAQDALALALQFMPNDSVLFMLNLHLSLESVDPGPRISSTQALWNCRDPFKASRRMVVILCPDCKVPVELSGDVITLDMDMPGEPELVSVVEKTYEAAGLDKPGADLLAAASAALLGLSPFAAEQVAAMSIRKSGMDVPAMWEMKIADINHTSGLRAERGGKSKFENLLGLENIVEFGKALLAGEDAPQIIVLVEEIEKQLAGTGDNTGVNQDQVSTLLTAMEENGWDGMLLPGLPGTGKSEFCKCLGAAAGMFVWLDLGAAKDSLVGSSEKKIRAVMSKLKAMGGSKVFFACSCNGVATIPGPLYRRLSAGTYFFDLPGPKAQEAIWEHYMGVYGLPKQPLPDHVGWTGAEIKKCVQWARRLRQTLVQAAMRITPVAKTMQDEVQKLREQAHGKYLSASVPGFYQSKLAPNKTARQISAGRPSGGSN